MRRWIHWLIVLAAVALISVTQAEAQADIFKRGELLVHFKPGTPLEVQSRAIARVGGTVIQRFDHLNVLLISIPPGKEFATAAALRDDPRIDVVEPNYAIHAAAIPNDPNFSSRQWNLVRVAAPAAWDLVRHAHQVLIAVVDSGVDYNHPDLRAARWLNPAESTWDPWLDRLVCDRDGIDDDANGYIDDCYGWDWVDYDAAPLDGNGHGTQVAGIAAAVTDNGVGIAGMSWGAQFVSLRVLDNAGNGNIGDLIAALDYLRSLASSHVVVNMSLALPPGVYSEILRLAVEDALAHGMLLVAASGNEGRGQVDYPAAYAGVLAVGATDALDARWSYSNYGSALDVVAPGVEIFSTTRGFTYVQDTGTSFATPHVSGLAALIWSANPGLTAEQVAGLINTTADDVNAAYYPGPDVYMGWGRINAYRAVLAATEGLSLTLTAEPSGVPVGGRTTITATVLQPDQSVGGTGLVISFEASLGSVAPPVALTEQGVVTTTFTAGPVQGVGVVTATLGTISRVITVPISSGDPYTITLTADPPLLAAGGGARGQAVLRARVRDAAGHAARDGLIVSFATDLGIIHPITDTIRDGVAVSTLVSGPETGQAHITATIAGLIATADVEIVGAGQPFSLTLTADTSEVTVGGGRALITATLRDVDGAPVAAGYPVTFQAVGGDITPDQAQTDEHGQATAIFIAGEALGGARVIARSGPVLQDALELLIIPGEPEVITVTAASPEIEVGDHYLPITATVTDQLGNPVRDGTFINFATTLGQMTALRTATRQGRALSELRAGPTPGTARITATADNGAQGVVEVRIVPGIARRVALSVTPSTVPVGGEALLTARAWDAFDNPVRDGTIIHFQADEGLLGPPEGPPSGTQFDAEVREGSAQAGFFAPLTPGIAHITARAGLTATQTITVPVLPGGPARLLVTADATLITPDRDVVIRARVQDAYGNPVADGTTVRFATTLGEITPRNVPTVNGIAEATFQPKGEVGDATIGVSVGDLFEILVIRVRAHIYYLPLSLRRP